MSPDWFDAWVARHVTRLSLRGRAMQDLTHYLADRRHVLVGQLGATAPRLDAVTQRCLFDSPQPRWTENRYDAVARHLKAVIADERKAEYAAAVGPAAPPPKFPVDAAAARRCAANGLHRYARMYLGESAPLPDMAPADLGRLYAAHGFGELAPVRVAGDVEPARPDPPPPPGVRLFTPILPEPVYDTTFDPETF